MRGGLDHERVVRVRRTTYDLHAARRQLNDEHGVYVTSPRHVHTSVVKKSAPAIAHQWARRNVSQEVGRAGTGGMPCAFRIRAIVDRPTRWPMFLRAPANARVAPGWVFFGNPHDELPDLLDHAGTSEPLAGMGPFPGDEVSVRET